MDTILIAVITLIIAAVGFFLFQKGTESPKEKVPVPNSPGGKPAKEILKKDGGEG